MSTEPKKFTFDVEFRPEGDLVSNAARARQRKVLTQEELDHMLTRSREQGMKIGQVRAAEATAAAVQQLCDVVHDTLNTAQNELESLRREGSQIAMIAARKLAQVAVSHMPQGDVEEALREAIHQAINEPRIVLRAAPTVIEAIKERIEEMTLELGYDGRIIATADPSIRTGDCRIEWRGGGAERSMQHLEAAISDVLDRHFSQISASTKG